MSTETTTPGAIEDLKSICASLAARQPADPVVARRVQERGDKIRAELLKQGTIEIAVDLLREAREER